jgi:hypothetical protein
LNAELTLRVVLPSVSRSDTERLSMSISLFPMTLNHPGFSHAFKRASSRALSRGSSSLSAEVDAFRKKYVQHDRAHLVKALAYFGDADAASLPAGLDGAHWAELKQRTSARVRAL